MKRGLTLLLFCTLASSGCLLRDSPEPLDSRILITVRESLVPARSLRLDCRTDRNYSCLGYRLVTRHSRIALPLLVSFEGVSAPNGVCATALGPATASIAVNDVRDGRHPFRLNANGSSVAGELLVSTDSIVVRGGSGPWTVFPRLVLHRVPPGTIWGLIGWGPSDRSVRSQAFLDALESLGATRTLVPGDYDYFQVGPAGDAVPPPYFERAFALRYRGDRAALAGVVRAFGDSLSIRMQSDWGESWFSWLLRGP